MTVTTAPRVSSKDRTVSYSFDLPPVNADVQPVVQVSVSNHNKVLRAEVKTVRIVGVFECSNFAFGGAVEDKWSYRHAKVIASEPLPRYSAKRLQEYAERALAEFVANPERFARFFETDESAGER
jgi:hypothetical protein